MTLTSHGGNRSREAVLSVSSHDTELAWIEILNRSIDKNRLVHDPFSRNLRTALVQVDQARIASPSLDAI